MLALIGSIIQFIPGLTSLGQTWINSAYNAKVTEYVTKLNVDAATAQSIIAMEQAVQVRWWFVAAIPPLFALPFIFYIWRAVVWDNVVLGGEGSTPALHGDLQTIFLMVLSFYFIQGFRSR